MQLEALQVGRLKDQVVAERHPLAEELHLPAHRVAARGELPLLIVLAVVGQIRLGRQPQHAAAVDHHRAIEQLCLEPQRRADHQHRRQALARFDQARDRGLARVQQRVLMEQILIGIGGETQFREQRYGDINLGSLPRQSERPFEVEVRVGHA